MVNEVNINSGYKFKSSSYMYTIEAITISMTLYLPLIYMKGHAIFHYTMLKAFHIIVCYCVYVCVCVCVRT